MTQDGEAAPPEEPVAEGDLTEDEAPDTDEVFREKKVPDPTHTDKTRRLLALCILGALLLVYLAVFVQFLWANMPMERFTAAVAGISGLQALAAAAVGFYYGKGQHDHD